MCLEMIRENCGLASWSWQWEWFEWLDTEVGQCFSAVVASHRMSCLPVSLHLKGGLNAVVPFKCSERVARVGQSSRVERIVMGVEVWGKTWSKGLFEPMAIAAMGYPSSTLLMRTALCEVQITVVGYAWAEGRRSNIRKHRIAGTQVGRW